MALEVIPEGRQLTFITPEYPFYHFPKHIQDRIMDSFEGFFHDKILPLIPFECLKELYSPKQNVRPANGISIVAAILYMRAVGIKEHYFLHHIHSDIAMQYAVGTEDEINQPFSERTFSRFRRRLLDAEDRLSINIWDTITSKIEEGIADAMNLNKMFSIIYTAAYRIDSLMIDAHAAHMTRLQLLYTGVRMAVLLMVNVDAIEYIPCQLTHYLDTSDDHKYTYYKGTIKELEEEYSLLNGNSADTPTQNDGDAEQNRKNRLVLIQDLRLRRLCEDLIHAKAMLESVHLTSSDEFVIITRLLDEQLEYDVNGKPIPKDGKSIKGSSLQSLFDTFMTYRRKNDEKNYGYTGCCAEIYSPSGSGCIVWRQFEQNIYSDQQFANNFYDYIIQKYRLQEQNINRIAVSCDALFTSASLQAKVRDARIDIYCASTGYTPDPILASFCLNQELNSIIKCPENHVPISTFYPEKMGGTIVAKFQNGECASCRYCLNCKATTGKRGVSTVELRLNQVLAAKNIKNLKDPVFHMFVDKRNGVESIPAALRKGYAVDECPHFGYRLHQMHFFTSTTALNIKKYYRYYKHEMNKNR